MKTVVYFDALNFYFGAIKGTPFRWVDLVEVAVLITGDSDLVSPLRVVQEEIGKRVGVINPQSRPCKPLRDHATFYRQSIRSGVLAASQFPTAMTDTGGTFHKPPTW